MRDPNRLHKFYGELQKIQFSYFPDMNFVQFILGFIAQYKYDPFFPEEDMILKDFEKYGKSRARFEWDGMPGFNPATYDTLRDVHMKYFPDWRFGQLLVNFLGWCGIDPAGIDEEKFVELFNKFANGENL